MSADGINARLLLRELKTAVIGRAILCFDSVGSTNRVARQYAEKNAAEGTVVLADYQTGGRGRLNRSWLAPPQSSLLCSVLLYPPVKPEYLFQLTMLTSIAVVDALRVAAGIASGIKWPNDIYVGGKKICGILTEVDCLHDAVRYAVVGIGLNVNWSLKGTELENQATSVKDICGRDVPRHLILKELLQQLDMRYASITDCSLPGQWQQRCMHLDRPVQVLCGQDCLQGIARGITAQGHLILESAAGLQEILCGDVSLRW